MENTGLSDTGKGSRASANDAGETRERVVVKSPAAPEVVGALPVSKSKAKKLKTGKRAPLVTALSPDVEIIDSRAKTPDLGISEAEDGYLEDDSAPDVFVASDAALEVVGDLDTDRNAIPLARALPVIDPSGIDEDDESDPESESTSAFKDGWVPPSSDSGSGLLPMDPLQRYMAEIRSFPTLSREEEHDLAVKYFRHGDNVAGYRLVVANLRLVVMIAREYQRNVNNILDLVQEGNIGLLEAVKQYDPFRGIRFPSYAVYWIRAYMLRHLINNIRLVKIGTTQAQRKLFFNLQKERDKLELEGFVPEAKLLAERLHVKESEVLEMEQRLALPDLSVDAPISGFDDSVDLHGILPDHSATAEQEVVRAQFADALNQAVNDFKLQLDGKERAIIEQRLFTDDPVTLQVIADQFGLSRERIRQIENRLKEQLKVFLSDRLDLTAEDALDVSE